MNPHQHSPHEIRREIDVTRRELGATVEALAAKTAVKARLRDRFDQVRDEVKLPLRAAAVAGTAIVLLVVWTHR